MSNVILNNNELAVIREFTSDYDGKYYGRALARKLKMNQKTVSNILNKLEKEHIIKFAKEGKNKYYFLNKLHPSIKEIVKFVEINKKIIFYEHYKKLYPLFSEIEKRAEGLVIIFGSYVNFTSNKDSDLDIFSIGKISHIQDLEKLYNIKINIIHSSESKFDTKDTFIKEIIKNHIIIKGIEEYIDLVWQA